jgi:putative sterol carrier protein
MIMPFTEPAQAFEAMIKNFSAEAAQGVDAVFQWEIVGDGGGVWHIKVADGACQLVEGRHDSPTVGQLSSPDLFLGMVNLEVDGMQAFMSGQLKVTGDMMLAQRIMEIFPL